ncbi:MAG: hypothetical protein ACYSVY_23640, partial [Planctomycetota bacterium]
MPADERIKVIFKRVLVRDDADTFGSGEFYFTARVDGVSVGNPNRIFNAVEHRYINLPAAQWSHVVNVRGDNAVLVMFKGMDEDVFVDDYLGLVQHTLRRPYQQVRSFRHSTRYFLLEWDVELAVRGAFGRHPSTSVFATRQTAGGVTCTTVSGARFLSRMEIHPCRPVPVPPPATVLPVRPAFPAGTAAANNNGGATVVSASDPINKIPNPAVIPVLGPPEAAVIGPHTPAAEDAATWANARNAARIEYSYYRPGTLNFTDNDSRLEWRAVPVAGGGNVAFLGDPKGRKVMVYGTSEGEVRLEVRFKGTLFATYRALVRNLRQVPCRCNILNGSSNDSTPRVTPDDCKNHVDLANRFLRQAGLQLTLDTSPRRTNGATATAHPGIFRISVPRGWSRDLDGAGAERATRLNYRDNVMNFAYVHSDEDGNMGAATDFPNSSIAATTRPPGYPGATTTPVRPVVQDTGTSTTSWVRPTGVGIGADATATPQSMWLINGIQRLDGGGNATDPRLFAMYVTDVCGGPGGFGGAGNHATPARQREYANTMAHEFGHILNLGHRVEGVPETAPGAGDARDMTAADLPATLSAGGIFWDGLLHPPHENLM